LHLYNRDLSSTESDQLYDLSELFEQKNEADLEELSEDDAKKKKKTTNKKKNKNNKKKNKKNKKCYATHVVQIPGLSATDTENNQVGKDFALAEMERNLEQRVNSYLQQKNADEEIEVSHKHYYPNRV